MTGEAAAAALAQLAEARRTLSGRVLAATLSSVRDLDIAEESTADAFLLAVQTWPEQGVPRSVEAWLITAAKRRAIDRVRRAQVARRALITMTGGWSGTTAGADSTVEAAVVGDDDLRMVVLCCDPRIPEVDQVALTLRLACGISTAAIAAAHRVSTPTMAARLTRAKAKLAAAGPQLDLPDDATVDRRLPAVARVVHLAFTLGHTAADGDELTDEDLADRADYLARVLHAARPADPDLTALHALVLLTRARAAGRFDAAGQQVLLADADRRLWDRELIRRGLDLLVPFAAGGRGPMVAQALVAAEHARAADLASTDWPRILRLYDEILSADPAPGFAVGRCVALSHLRGPYAALADLDEVMGPAGLQRDPYAHAARARFLTDLGRDAEAALAWAEAARHGRTTAEKDFFGSRGVGGDVRAHSAVQDIQRKHSRNTDGT
ncbi:RNA polymerase sigma factor [Nakamurella sp. YIM 132087]|uniref:RNA polymerase sigma factor n=1 Tax=Nakamurella alba TaxID=2665158 RepID=A0A7K1FQB2_9ACTN|nr:RNA polymerase sigma factor [Nakamurella alba]